MELLIVGFDGMSERIVRKYLAEFPNLCRLCESSEYGCLISVFAGRSHVPHTGPAWTSSYTGVMPEVHGITTGGWLGEGVNYSDIKTITIWDLIQRQYSLGIMTMPITYPAPKINGWVISGFPANMDDHCFYPQEIRKYLKKGFQIDYVSEETDLFNGSFDKEKQDNIESQKVEILKSIYQDYETDVTAIGFTLLDRYNHLFPQFACDSSIAKFLTKVDTLLSRILYGRNKQNDKKETYYKYHVLFELMTELTIDRSLEIHKNILHAYKFADRLLGELVDFFAPNSLVLYSDHGFKKYGRALDFVGHDLNGFYLVSDDRTEHKENPRTISEIGPIILDLLGVENTLGSPREMGKTILIKDQARERIKKQLEALGYI